MGCFGVLLSEYVMFFVFVFMEVVINVVEYGFVG